MNDYSTSNEAEDFGSFITSEVAEATTSTVPPVDVPPADDEAEPPPVLDAEDEEDTEADPRSALPACLVKPLPSAKDSPTPRNYEPLRGRLGWTAAMKKERTIKQTRISGFISVRSPHANFANV